MSLRETMVSMENGLRKLNIPSMNPDSTKRATTQQEIVKEITENRIHIAAIQETHITQDRIHLLGNYRIITASPDKREQQE